MRNNVVSAARCVIICVLCIAGTILSCSQIRNSNSFFTENELKLLKSTTEAIDYGYGYDSRLKLHYIFSFSHSNNNPAAKEHQLAGVINSTPINDIEMLYFKVLRVKAQIEIQTAWFKKMEDWRNYTYLKNYLSPAVDSYLEIMKRNIASRDSQFFEKDKIQIRKAAAWAAWYYYNEHETVDTF